MLSADGTLLSLGGFTGHTKRLRRADKGDYIELAGQAEPIEPEEVELLSDADVLSLLNGEQK